MVANLKSIKTRCETAQNATVALPGVCTYRGMVVVTTCKISLTATPFMYFVCSQSASFPMRLAILTMSTWQPSHTFSHIAKGILFSENVFSNGPTNSFFTTDLISISNLSTTEPFQPPHQFRGCSTTPVVGEPLLIVLPTFPLQTITSMKFDYTPFSSAFCGVLPPEEA